jgi:Flp pilus assembly protein TadD
MIDAAREKSIVPATREEREAADRSDLLSQASFWGREYGKNANDNEAALKFSRVLRAIGSAQRATEIAGQALNLRPGDVELTLVYAQSALDIGRPDLAAGALARIEASAGDDWRIASIIGVTMDQHGRHKDAQAYYARALEHSPDNPKVLSNLGLSLALSEQPERAEETLRRAAAAPGADIRVRQNLLVVLGVQGKFAEAEEIAGIDAPPDLVQDNIAYFKRLLSPQRTWDGLRGSQR